MRIPHKLAAHLLPFLIAVASYAQLSPSDQAPAPSFSITANVLENVVKARSEVLLEIAMTNRSKNELVYGIDNEFPIWRLFEIDFRDSAGNPVPMTPAGQDIERGNDTVLHSALVRIKPGKTLQAEMILNRVFDLSRPGSYRIEIRMRDRLSGILVTSSPITVTVPAETTPHKRTKPAFSIALTAPIESLKAGWRIPVSIVVKNISTKDLNLAIWDGRILDEFGAGLEVTNSDGKPVPLTTDAALNGCNFSSVQASNRAWRESIRGSCLKQR